VTFNGVNLPLTRTSYGTLTSKREVSLPEIALPTLSNLPWVSDATRLFDTCSLGSRNQPAACLKSCPITRTRPGLSQISQPQSTRLVCLHPSCYMQANMDTILAIFFGVAISMRPRLKQHSKSKSWVVQPLATQCGLTLLSSVLGKATQSVVTTRALSNFQRS